MLNFYNTAHVKIAGLTAYKDYYIEQATKTGIDILHFKYPLEEANSLGIAEECYVENEENEYVIKENNVTTTQNGITYREFVADLNVEAIKGKLIDNFNPGSVAADAATNLALVDTGWSVDKCYSTKHRTAKKANCTAFEALEDIKKAYGIEFQFFTKTKTINIYEARGSDRGAYFCEEVNLTELKSQGTTRQFCTRLHPRGKDGLTIKKVNDGVDYVYNYQYTTKVIDAYWIDNRYTNANDLMADAQKRLDYLSKPQRSYGAKIVDLAAVSDVYSYLDFEIGDTITLMSKSTGTSEKQRIIKINRYPDEPERSTVEISNKIASLEDIILKVAKATQNYENISDSTGSVMGSSVEVKNNDGTYSTLTITIAKIGELIATKADITTLEADYATIKSLTAVTGLIETLESTMVKTEDLSANYIKATDIDATYAKISDLNANYIKATEIASAYAKITDLDAAKGRIEKLESNSVTTTYLTSNYIKTTDIAATYAKISDVSANYVTTTYLSANYIKTTDIAATYAKISDVSANYAAINLANVENGSIKQAMIDTGAVGTAQIADGSITNAKVVDLSANSITAGTLSVERLIITGSNNSIVYAINNANGTAQLSATTIDGGSLTQRSITADRIVANSITGNEIAANAIIANSAIIADGAIGNAKISDLDAAKIKTGFIAADRINTGSITFAKLDSAAVKSINDLVQVGERNLLLDTQKLVANDEVSAIVGTIHSDVLFNGCYTLFTNKAWTGYKFNFSKVAQRCNIKVGDVVTYCIYAKFDAKPIKNAVFSFYTLPRITGVDNTRISKNLDDINANEWFKMSYTFTVTTDLLNVTSMRLESNYYENSDYTTAVANVWFSAPFLKMGNKVGDWSPAPEDIYAEISKQGIANWCYNNDLTYINGAKIYTGSITAEKLDISDVITALNANITNLHVDKINDTSGYYAGFDGFTESEGNQYYGLTLTAPDKTKAYFCMYDVEDDLYAGLAISAEDQISIGVNNTFGTSIMLDNAGNGTISIAAGTINIFGTDVHIGGYTSRKLLWSGTCLGGASVTVDMSAYTIIEVHAYCYKVPVIVRIDLTSVYPSTAEYYGGGIATQMVTDSSGNARIEFHYVIAIVNAAKTSVSFETGYEKANAINTRDNNSSYYVSAIYGVDEHQY